MKTVIKPWGKEEWLELNDRYCYKRIYINAGYKTSYQYHNFKKETNYIISGEAEVWLENDEGVVEKKLMKAGDYFNVTPPKKHRVIALTDIILQEVSTPEVDDVIRINDEFARGDGKIEGEHQTPAVLILAAGLGTRLESLTKEINKALLPINNRAIISHIIDKFPKDYEFVVAIGYKGELVKEYCKLVFPNHKFTFVEIDNIEESGSGPGYSALKCREYLQRPFYITTCDCLIDSPMPHLDGNWLGVQPTSYPEKYSTVLVDGDNIINYSNKSIHGYNLAFIGLAGIWDYEVFWNKLESRTINGELVSAFEAPLDYPTFKIKKLKWLDTGNIDDLNKAKQYFNDVPLSLQKDNNELTYREGNLFIKFTPDPEVLKNRIKRAILLKEQIPLNFGSVSNFIYYDWVDGDTLYELDDFNLFKRFLNKMENNLKEITDNSIEHIINFYINKTHSRVQKFVNKNGHQYHTLPHIINGKEYPAYDSFFTDVVNNRFHKFQSNSFYKKFHGDLQFDNIIFSSKENEFKYIDWRESFGGYTEAGDIYYDLAKLYGGCIIPYNKMKNEDNINFVECDCSIRYSYDISDNLVSFKKEFENWIIKMGFDMDKVKIMTGLIFLNMSPLHDEKFSKMLWFKSIEILYEYADK
jgi:NDP-sugar pyrophosphorylase family protein/mannose-6-phosphate isomerase-like protein (cupin superfamily)